MAYLNSLTQIHSQPYKLIIGLDNPKVNPIHRGLTTAKTLDSSESLEKTLRNEDNHPTGQTDLPQTFHWLANSNLSEKDAKSSSF